jgi:hypothetical protein
MSLKGVTVTIKMTVVRHDQEVLVESENIKTVLTFLRQFKES